MYHYHCSNPMCPGHVLAFERCLGYTACADSLQSISLRNVWDRNLPGDPWYNPRDDRYGRPIPPLDGNGRFRL